MSQKPHGYRSGELEILPGTAEVRCREKLLHLEPLLFRVLLYLIECRNRLVSKEELLGQVWDDSFVTEGALTKAVGRLRSAIGDNSRTPRFIQTFHGRGYRFVAAVEEFEDPTRAAQHAAPTASGVSRKRLLLVAGTVVGVVSILLASNLVDLRRRLFGEPTRPKIRSLAVLPLRDLGGDPEQEHFAGGLQEALITDLSTLGSLQIISRQSTLRFRRSEKSTPQIARELGVDAVVEGSVLREGGRIAVWVQLIHGETDRHLWARRYEGDAGEVLVVLAEVAQAIAEEIEVAVTPEESKTLASARSLDPHTHDLYLRGRHFLKQLSPDGVRRARAQFLAVAERDPGFAPAYAGLGYTYFLEAITGAPPRDVMPQARVEALRAIELDDRLAEAYTLLGWVRLTFDWDWPGAGQALRRALELNPNDPLAHHGYADYLTVMGRPEDGLRHVLTGRELDPLSAWSQLPVLFHLGFLDRDQELIEECRKTLALFPGLTGARSILGWALWREGRIEEAVRELRQLSEADPILRDAFEEGLAAGGPRAALMGLAEALAQNSETRGDDPWNAAAAFARAGESKRALDWLDRAFEHRSIVLVLLEVAPDFDGLRSEPRFTRLVEAIGLPEASRTAD